MLTQLTIFLYIVIFLYGIVIGSFLNVLIFRIPKKENIVQSSHCRFHGGRFHVQQCAVLPHDICPDCHCGHR